MAKKESDGTGQKTAPSKDQPAGGRRKHIERMIFADNFKRLREDLGLSQRAVAAKLSINQPFISDVETGRTNLTIDRMSELARFLGVPLHELLRPQSKRD